MFGVSISQQQAYQKGEGSASLVTSGLVCSIPCGPRRSLSDFPGKLGKLSIMQMKCWCTGTKAAQTQSGIHSAPQSQQAGVGGHPRVTTGADSVLPLPLTQCRDEQWDTSTGTPSPNSRRWNRFSGAGILQTEQKEQSRCQAVCSTALLLQAPLWSSNSFKGGKRRKTSHPAVC